MCHLLCNPSAPQEAPAGSNHHPSEAFRSGGVGDKASIKLGKFQFRRGRETNHFDLQLSALNLKILGMNPKSFIPCLRHRWLTN